MNIVSAQIGESNMPIFEHITRYIKTILESQEKSNKLNTKPDETKQEDKVSHYGVQPYMDEDERDEFVAFIIKYKTGETLVVNNRTYEVREEKGPDMTESMRAIANTYFNTKINVTNVDKRILAYLFSGFSIR
jgi:hypothetical protein